jgi:hypothetical protein
MAKMRLGELVTKDVTKKEEHGRQWQKSSGKPEIASLQYSPHKTGEGIWRFPKNKQYYQLLTGHLCQITFNIQKVCILPTAYLRVLYVSQNKVGLIL